MKIGILPLLPLSFNDLQHRSGGFIMRCACGCRGHGDDMTYYHRAAPGIAVGRSADSPTSPIFPPAVI